MARLAPGHVVAAAWHSMARSQRVAAGILANVAHAMTDVTGFGLAGHLMEMLQASACGHGNVLSKAGFRSMVVEQS